MAGEGGDTGRFHPFDVNAAHIAYAVLGGFVVLFGMFSLLIKEKLYLGEAPLATVFGIIIGPYAIGLFDPRSWGGGSTATSNAVTLEVTRVVLAVGVFAIGVELPKQYMLKHWKSLFFLLGPCMVYGWFAAAGLIYALVPALSFLSSLVIAACLTPTDPILAAAVVGGKYANKHVPAHLRHILAAESGCNDGAAFPFLYIALYLTLLDSDGKAVGEWFYITWLYEVILGIVFGSVLGFAFRHLMKFCERKNLIDRHSYVAQYISLAALAIGSTTLLGSDDLLAAFSCGTAFAWDGWFNRQTEESQFSNVLDLLFNCACFIYIGAWIPFNDFNSEQLSLTPWRLVIIGILVLLLRRLPVVIGLYKWIPDVKTFREALFSGHFGPMGVGAVFIATLASTKLPETVENPTSQVELLAGCIQPIIAFMVLCSIVTHGLSIPFFSLGRRVHSVTFTYTWSRRQSIDPTAPEWATQVRRMPSRREDIVINRDEKDRPPAQQTSDEDRMEKGLGGSSEGDSGTHTAAGGSGGSGTQTPAAEADIADAEGLQLDDDTGRRWREGRDLIIETQADPAEEVQVRVIKDAFPNEDGIIPAAMADRVRKEVQNIKAEVQKGINPNIQPGPSRVTDVLAAARLSQEATRRPDDSPQHHTINTPTSPRSPYLSSRPTTADDTEWNDEPADDPPSPSVAFEEPKRPAREERSRSPHKKRKHILSGSLGSRRGRRRDSVRRAIFNTGRKARMSNDDSGDEGGGLSSADHSAASSPASSVVDLPATGGDDGIRGRSEYGALGGIPASRRSSMRPANRSRVPSRTASPAPSRIRFADEADSTSTPTSPTPGIIRNPSGLIHSSTPHESIYSTPTPGSESGRVMFNLGNRPERS